MERMVSDFYPRPSRAAKLLRHSWFPILLKYGVYHKLLINSNLLLYAKLT